MLETILVLGAVTAASLFVGRKLLAALRRTAGGGGCGAAGPGSTCGSCADRRAPRK